MHDLLKLLAFLRPHWRFVALAPVLMVTEVVLDLLQPRFVQHIIDEGVAKSDLSVVLHTGVYMLAAALVAMTCGIGCTMCAVRAAYRMGSDIRGTVFRKVQTFSFANLDKLETGALITRLTGDANQVQEMVTMLLRGMVRMPLLLIGSVIMAVHINHRLGMIFFVIVPVLVTALVLIVRATFPLYREVQRKLDRLNSVLQENLAGVRVVKAFARGPHETVRFGRANDALINASITAVRMGAFTTPIMMLMLNSGIVAALWIGSKQVQLGGMQVGQVVAFINYLVQALFALILFSNLIIHVSRAQASARRVGELLATRPALSLPAPSSCPMLPNPRGRIVFENVTFAYDGARAAHEPELQSVSFTAEPGQTIAILGATGSGKSTLVQLIPRFYDVTAGRITLDGFDVRTIPEPELRRHIGIALQESVLFSNTIRANLVLGKPDATDEEVFAAARIAQADEFIRGFPEGYDTLVGQRGVNLSGGQRQRLAIARAILPKPAVLILDDCTSAVDVATEARIQAGLARAASVQTRIIVAQRISSVVNADRIIVLEDGRVAGDGTHAELILSCPVYREIHESQTENVVLTHGGE